MERRMASAVRRDPRLANCGDLRKVDFRRLSAEVADRTPPSSDEWKARAGDHAAARGPYGAFAAPDDAQIVLTMFAGATGHQMVRGTTSSVVWKGTDGVWRVNAVDHVTGGPPIPPRPLGEPAYTPDEYERMQRKTTIGVLSPSQAAILDEAIDDVCLDIQPDLVPWEIPVLGGGIDHCRPDTGGLLQMAVRGRQRIIIDGCARYTAGRIMRVVMYPRTAASPVG